MTERVEREEWMALVQETFARLRYAGRDAQDAACEEMGRYGEEAAEKLRELFDAEHAKVRRLVDKAKKVADELRPKDGAVKREKPKAEKQGTLRRRSLSSNARAAVAPIIEAA